MIFFFVLMVVAVLGSGVRGRILEADFFRPSPTSFTCQGRPAGYYADVDTGCRTYHVCDGVSHFTYVCPRRTLFRQDSRICDHSYLVQCGEEADTANRDDEEEILARLAEFKKRLLRKETDEDDDDQTQGLIPFETTQPVEPTETTTTPSAITTVPTGTTTPATAQKRDPEGDTAVQSVRKFLKFRLKDPRSLFFIPELSNNSVAIEPSRELVLPIERADFMRFRPRKKVSHTFSACPGYCDPRFFLRGTCHPCIMIK